MTPQPTLEIVSLFGGIGGIDYAGQLAGMTTRLICEVDKPAQLVLRERFPDAVIHDDVRTLTADDIAAAGAVPGRTVLTAGFPCQDLSVAGRRKGMGEGTRSGLFWEVDRLLAEFRPAWVLLENVAGLLSATCACQGDGRCGGECPGEVHSVANGGACDRECVARHGGVMGAVLGSLAERGYGFAYRVLDARFFGVPQRRRRVAVVGRLGDSGAAAAEILLEPEGLRGDSAAGSETRQGAARGVGDSVTGGSRSIGFAWQAGGDGTASGAFADELSPTLQVNQTMAVGVLGEQPHALTAEGADASEDGTGRGTPVIAFHITQDPISGDVAPAMGAGNAQGCATIGVSYVAEHVSALDTAQGGPDDNSAQAGHLVAYPLAVRGREGGAQLEVGDADDPMFSLRAGDGGSSRSQLIAIHENQRGELTVSDTAGALKTGGGKPGQGYPAVTDGVIVRRLTPLECERLQGLPDGWTDVAGASDSQRYKQLGNSVAVPVFAWVLRRLAAVADRLEVAA